MAKPPDVTVTRIGNQVFEQPDERDELSELDALSRPADDSQGPSVTYITPEEELALGEVSGAPPKTLSPEEAGSYYTQGAAKEASTLGAAGLGFMGGFRLGAPAVVPATPFLGPAASAIPFVTGAIGAVAGYQGAKSLADSIVEDPNPEDLGYPSFEAGRTVGGSIALAPLAFFIPPSVAARFGRIGPFISRIGESARKYPKSFLLGETTAGLSSSVGTYIAETEFPGEMGKRFGLEVAFGVADPARIVPLVTSKGMDILKTGWSLRNQAGREAFAASQSQATMDRATKRLVDIFEQYGEDIPELIKRLEAPLVGEPTVAYPPVGALAGRTGPTAAQKTGSDVVTQLEAALSALDPKFAADVTEQGRQSLLAYSLVLDRLKEIGSPDALKAAAEMRRDFFDNALEARLNRATTRASEKFSRITSDSPQARIEIGRTIYDEVELALKNAREAERIFWLNAQRQALAPRGRQRITEVVPTARETTQAYEEAAARTLADLRSAQRRVGSVDFNNSRQVSRLTGQKAKSFTQYLKENLGGITIDSEWLARDLNGRTRPGLFLANTPANRSRAGMDAIREAAFDGGYFSGKTDYRQITDDEIFDAVANDTPQSRFWQASVREKLADAQAEQEFLIRQEAEYGIRADMTQQEIANRLRAVDDARRAEGRDDLAVMLDKQRKVTRSVDIPNTLAPDTFVNAYLERVSQIDPAFVNDLVPSNVQALMKRLGVTQQVIDRYRAGRRTRQFAETGVMDPRFRPRPGAIKNIPVEELINARSNLLALGTQASSRGDAAHSNFYSIMQTALLDDLSTLPGDAYDTARNFSRSLNDTFTRTFANNLLAVSGTGAQRIPVETLVSNAFGAGVDRTALRMGQIENAVGFLKQKLDDAAIDGVSTPEEAARLKELQSISSAGIVSIRDAQSRVLRLAAAKALRTDPQTGAVRLNPVQLNKFVNENKALLDEMGITGDLQDAQQAENLLAAVVKQNSALNTTVRDQMAFSKVLGVESPKTAIANALSPNNKHPIRSMRQLADLARKGGPEAVEGLKASLYDYIFTKSSGGTTKIDPQLYYDTFFKKYAVDQPNLAEVLRVTGIMSPDEIKNVRAIADQMRMVEDAMENRRMLENVLQGADVVGELAMRVVGSKIGTSASGGGPGALIAASAGSKAIRQIFDQMPMLAVRQLIQDAARNPQLMAQLLRRNLSEREKLLFARRLHAYTLAAGLNYITYTPPPEEKELMAPGAGTAIKDFQALPYYNPSGDRLQRFRPPAPTTRGVPGMTPPAGGAPPAGGGGGAPPTSQSRMMLQQLFPNDAIMGAAAVQAGTPPTPG